MLFSSLIFPKPREGRGRSSTHRGKNRISQGQVTWGSTRRQTLTGMGRSQHQAKSPGGIAEHRQPFWRTLPSQLPGTPAPGPLLAPQRPEAGAIYSQWERGHHLYCCPYFLALIFYFIAWTPGRGIRLVPLLVLSPHYSPCQNLSTYLFVC